MKALPGVVTFTVFAALMVAQAALSRAAEDALLMCFCKPATIVGTHGPDFIVGGPEDVLEIRSIDTVSAAPFRRVYVD